MCKITLLHNIKGPVLYSQHELHLTLFTAIVFKTSAELPQLIYDDGDDDDVDDDDDDDDDDEEYRNTCTSNTVLQISWWAVEEETMSLPETVQMSYLKYLSVLRIYTNMYMYTCRK